jgi:(p)ppGpp synthase/HD superfamily hydrolase
MSTAVKIDLIAEAKAFATCHHRHQRWGHAGEPYAVHLEAVARLVKAVPSATPEMVAAAWLHDVENDLDVRPGEIRETFGDQVALLVGELTDPANLEDGDRSRHAEINRLHAAMASQEAQTIKLADLVEQAGNALEGHGKADETYMNEALQLLLALQGDPHLWELAWNQVSSYFRTYQGRELARP